MLLKTPYFSPLTPPLGIAIIKAYIEQFGYQVACFDFNTDVDLWGMHHKYFDVLLKFENVSMNDGYSKLWYVLNGHLLAYANGAPRSACARVVKKIAPLFGILIGDDAIERLLRMVEEFFRRLEQLTGELDLSNVSVVGASTYTTSLGPSLHVLRRIKETHPEILTIMGGGVFADDLALGSDNLDTLIAEYPFVDRIVIGEGEMLMLKVLEGELGDKRVVSLADMDNKTVSVRDLPAPDFSDLNIENYYHLSIEGARSCPFQCSFCSETIQWGDYRKKPVDRFAQQVIELAERYNKNTFFLGDSLMNPYIAEFSTQLVERKADVLYDGYLRADKPVSYDDRVQLWARSGLYRARLGIESASAQVLNRMDKMTSPATISAALRALAKAGIRTTTYWIAGFPGETEENFQETLEFIREHKDAIYELEAHPYYYYPYGQVGSRLYQCVSLYPDDVTEVIKFRIWEVAGAEPDRAERFSRLRRMSSLASRLGLPNIYSMKERLQAEDRWISLYPNAVEMY